jgi:hypothetical protein
MAILHRDPHSFCSHLELRPLNIYRRENSFEKKVIQKDKVHISYSTHFLRKSYDVRDITEGGRMH